MSNRQLVPTKLIDGKLRACTADIRILPNFLIVGTPKSGTSFLYEYLTQHPQVLSARTKEILFFERKFDLGLRWYRSNFPLSVTRWSRSRWLGKHIITGEASPYYLQHPQAAQRIKDSLPQVKLIAILRDPVERAWSHYKHNVRHGRENLSFREAIEQEEHRQFDSDDPRLTAGPLHFAYKSAGHYFEHLHRFYQLFEDEQILVLNSDDVFQNPGKVFAQVFSFLSIDPFIIEDVEPVNVGMQQELAEDIRTTLHQYFAPRNQRLRELGLSFNWMFD